MSQHDQNQTSNETGTRTSVAWLPYIETLVVLGIMVGVNLLWFEDHWGYLDKKPHLFWIVVVLIPLQYGLVVGIFSGLAASAGHVLFQATQDSPHYSFDFSDISYTVPVLMVLAAVVVGEGRQRGLSRYREVTERSKSLERAVEDLATQYTESEEAKALLQRRILTQTSTFTSLYEVARKLETLEESEIPPAAAQVTASFLEADLVSVCSYSDGKLEVLATYPVDQTSRVNDDLLTVSPVMRKSLASGQAVSLRDLVTSVPPDQLAREPVAIAAPILESQGEVRGFILAEKIGFFQFTPAALTTTSTIARWTSHSLQAAHLYHETKDRNIEDDLTGAYGSQYMLTRLQEEISRAEKFHFPLSVAVLDINRHSDLLPDSMPTVLAVLGDVFRHKLGSADLVGRHPDGVSLVIACRPSAIMGHI